MDKMFNVSSMGGQQPEDQYHIPLNDFLTPMLAEIEENISIFLQDGAPAHTEK